MVQKAGVIITDGEYILAEMPFGYKIQPGCLDVPKGHLDEGEDPLTGAVRETYEETTIRVPIEELIEIPPITCNGNMFHFYLWIIENKNNINLDMLRCPSEFYHEDLETYFPEVQGFLWLPLKDECLMWIQPDLRHCIQKVVEFIKTSE